MKSSISFENTAIAFEHKSNKELNFSIFIFKIMNNARLVAFLTFLTKIALKIHLPISPLVKATIFKQFCGGTSINDCDSTIKQIGKAGIGAILDYSVEGAEEEEVFETTKNELIKIILKAKNNNNIPVSCMKITGIARFSLLEKLSTGNELNESEKEEYRKVFVRFQEICNTAKQSNVPIYVDAEESWIQPAIDRLVESMMRIYNKEKAIIFTTLQMYRWDKLEHFNKLIEEAKHERFVVGIKFVRGAYMEKENERAEKFGYKTPIQGNKQASDNDYNKALEIAIKNINLVSICAGTHNEKSSLLLAELMEMYSIEKNDSRIYFSQLYGMSDHISYNLAVNGYNVTKYLPYGPVNSTVPYLIRRAEENSSISGQMGKELRLLLLEKARRKNT